MYNICCFVDGIREKDKNSLSAVLNQIGTLNARDNSFSLAKHLYNEVQTEWPGYTDTDRTLLKRYIIFISLFNCLIHFIIVPTVGGGGGDLF